MLREDPAIAALRVSWVVSDGKAEVRSGGTGSLHLDARGLASLYTGFCQARELKMAGRLDGPVKSEGRTSANHRCSFF